MKELKAFMGILKSDNREMPTSCMGQCIDILADSSSRSHKLLMLLGVFIEQGRPL